ncbi:MAG: hypothetical protein V4451_05690 [Pseudomonadota bacterium]
MKTTHVQLDVEGAAPETMRLIVTALEGAPKNGEFIVRCDDSNWSTDVIPLAQRVIVDLNPLGAGAELSVLLYDKHSTSVGLPIRLALPGQPITTTFSQKARLADFTPIPKRSFPTSTTAGWVVGCVLFVGILIFLNSSSREATHSLGQAAAPELLNAPLPSNPITAKQEELKLAKQAASAVLTHSVAAQRANLRSEPRFSKNTRVTELPVDTELTVLRVDGEFVEVRTAGGASGFLHKDVIVPVEIGRRLKGASSARLDAEFPRAELDKTIELANQSVKGISLSSPSLNDRLIELENVSKSSIKTNSDAARYLAFRAKASTSDGNMLEAEALYQAALRADPFHVDSVFGVGALMLKQGKSIPYELAIQSIFVAPRTAMPWILFAAFLAGTSKPQLIPLSLDIALRYSKDVPTTRRFLSETAALSTSEAFKVEVENAIRRAP